MVAEDHKRQRYEYLARVGSANVKPSQHVLGRRGMAEPNSSQI